MPPKRSIVPSWLGKYGVKEVNGRALCVKCQHVYAAESIKPNKLQRHLETHRNIFALSEDARKRVFEKLAANLDKSQQIMMGSLNDEQKRQIFVLKTAFLIAKSKRPYVIIIIITTLFITDSLHHYSSAFQQGSVYYIPYIII